MKLQIACVADAANESKEGKLNITGQFDTIWAAEVPVQWPALVFAARINAEQPDIGDHNFELRILNSDGKLIARAGPLGANIGPPAYPGGPMSGNLILHIANALFEDYGDYVFELRVDGKRLDAIDLHVLRRPKQ